MICKHSFIKTTDMAKPIAGTAHGIVGVEVICIDCGQVRRAFVDGTVEIVHPGGKSIDEDHAIHS